MTIRPRSFLPQTLAVTAGNGPIAGYTQRYNLNLVNYDWVTWHNYEWENWVVLDALLNAALAGTVIEGAWKPNTAYTVNDVVVDTRDGTMLIAVASHTSSENLDADIAAGKWGDYDISGAPVTVSAAAPSTPKPGDLWYATTEPVGLYVWYNDGNSAQWVQTNGGEGTPDLPLTGGTLSGPLIIDNAALTLLGGHLRIEAATPFWEFRETDLSVVGGLMRTVSNAGSLALRINTAVAGDYSTYAEPIRISRIEAEFKVPIVSDQDISGGVISGSLQHKMHGGYFYIGSYNLATYGTGWFRGYYDAINKRLNLQSSDANNANPAAVGIAGGGWSIDDSGDATFPGQCDLAATDFNVNIGATGGALLRFKRSTAPGTNYINVPVGANLRVQSEGGTAWASISSATGWAAGVSDQRLKRNIEPIAYGLDTVMQLRPVQFDWIEGGKHDIGLVAQDVLPIVPELVEEWAGEQGQQSTLSLRKDALVAVLIKAVQELTARVEALEAQ